MPEIEFSKTDNSGEKGIKLLDYQLKSFLKRGVASTNRFFFETTQGKGTSEFVINTLV